MRSVYVNERFHYFTTHPSTSVHVIHTLKCIHLMWDTEENSNTEKSAQWGPYSSNSPASGTCLHLFILPDSICIEARTHM